MAWARRALDGRIVHVSAFMRKETGLKCGCVCAGCGGELEAVNAGQSADHFKIPGTHRMSFRHHAGSQEGECRRIASRAALLQLLLDSGKVQLPGYRAKGSHKGLRGETYFKDAIGESLDEPIESAVWIDTHNAKITLPNGRVVRFQLRAETHVDSSVDAVVTFLIDDPEIAAWEADKIMSLAQLDGDWMCWDKHWDQDKVQAEANSLARQEAIFYCDAEPVVDPSADAEEEHVDPVDLPYSDPAWLADRTEAERQETLLHRVLKNLVAEGLPIRVARHSAPAFFQPKRGAPLSEWVPLPACSMTLSQARLEQHLGNIVPDVICQAGESLYLQGEVLVEIAVTHRVDEAKRAKIRARGTPCLELDATRLAGPRKLTVDALRKLVQDSPEAFKWIYNPRFDEHVEQVRLRLERDHLRREQFKAQEERAARGRERKARELAEQKEKFKRELRTKPVESLTQEYFQELIKHRFVFTLPEWRGDVQQAYAAAFADHGQAHLADKTFQKLLVYMRALRRAMEPRRVRDGDMMGTQAFEALDAAASIAEIDLRGYLPMLFTCLRICGARTDDEKLREKVIEEAKRVLRLVDEGATYYTRPPKYDAALKQLFPEFKEAFEDEARGTEAYAARRTREIREEKVARDRAEALAEQQRRDAAKEQLRLEIETALQPAVGKNWTFGGGKPFERWSGYSDALKREAQGHYSLIRAAYEAREEKQSVTDFMRTLQYRTVAKVETALAVLRSVYLLA